MQDVETQVVAALAKNDGREWEVQGAPASAAQNDAYRGRTGGCEPPLFWLKNVAVPDHLTSASAPPPTQN